MSDLCSECHAPTWRCNRCRVQLMTDDRSAFGHLRDQVGQQVNLCPDCQAEFQEFLAGHAVGQKRR